ncbi:SPFH/Band 7/PHB domain-containing membrane-associated protein family [Rhynchospora pubera]|uniref:SPFH/Band 7/PHB domain-containing membrane-associated protein family n=1 Tax=Rhynchospora pubera TaxID=906938 RepID=A0AAV8G410_9POAL|nr:SPFH/Band 7/PHB domain-containing membrane-associated protein family [Rhynchospora pubera]
MGQAFGCVKVPESTVAIRESWGKFDNVLDPGCHFVPWCSGKSIAGFVNLRLQQLVVSCETNTKLSNPKEQIKSYAYDAICARIQKLILDDVFEKTNEIVKDVKEEFKETMSMYGYEIVQILIVNIELDEYFERAMNESIAEKWTAESKHQNELAIARQRRAIADDLRDSIEAFSKNLPGISSTDFIEMVLATRYLDDTKEIAAQSKSVSISLGAGALKMVVLHVMFLRLL